MSVTARQSALLRFRCLQCGTADQHGHRPRGCTHCQEDVPSPLVAEYDHEAVSDSWGTGGEPGVWRYSEFLPIKDPASRVSLYEGSTPLLGPFNRDDGGRLWIKNESMNPTWSYKDRLAAVGVSAALEAGASTVVTSSSGNHGAAVAAYAAAAGLGCVVFTNDDASPATLTLIEGLGARLVRSSREGRRRLLIRGHELHGWYPLTSLTVPHVGNSYAIEGYKTIAFELAEQMGAAPGAVVVPTCYGEGMAGVAAGFADLTALRRLERAPRIVAVEPRGGGPLHRARTAGQRVIGTVEPYETIAQSIAGTTSSQRALTTLYDTGGLTVPVPDKDLVPAQRWLGSTVGIFGELSGVAGLAAVWNWPEDEAPMPEDVVVIMTGGGLRTADRVAGHYPGAPSVDPRTEDLDATVGRLDGMGQTWQKAGGR